MLKLRFRKKEELTKEFWVETMEWIAVGIGLAFICSIPLAFIPSIYDTTPDIPKLGYSLILCGCMFMGIAYMLRALYQKPRFLRTFDTT